MTEGYQNYSLVCTQSSEQISLSTGLMLVSSIAKWLDSQKVSDWKRSWESCERNLRKNPTVKCVCWDSVVHFDVWHVCCVHGWCYCTLHCDLLTYSIDVETDGITQRVVHFIHCVSICVCEHIDSGCICILFVKTEHLFIVQWWNIIMSVVLSFRQPFQPSRSCFLRK